MSEYITRGTYDDGRHYLSVVDSSDVVAEEFEARDLQGGGYTWIALLHSLAKLEAIAGELEIGGEGDNAFVNARETAVLDAFERAISRAMTDVAYLRTVLEAADPDMLE